jgi:glycosyltransferase involved in cell wall biosynthesis
MKILVLSSSFPYPTDIGRKSVMAGFLAYLIEEYGADSVVYATSDVKTDSRLAPFEVVALPEVGMARRGLSVAANSMLLRRMPIQEAMLCGGQVALERCVERVRPDLLFVDTIRMMRLAEPFLREAASVIYLDDLYSLRYERMLKLMRASPEIEINAIGSFSRFLPDMILPLVQMGQNSLLRFESHLLRQREIEAARKFDKALLINRDEAQTLSVASQRAVTAVKVLHIAKPGFARRFSGDPSFLFLGNLTFPPNAAALMLLLDAMPGITRSLPNVRINIVGRGASTRHRDRAAPFGSHLRFLDFVDDLDPLLSSSAALLAPIIFGTGIKIKILDALAYGVPVLGTMAAFDGIPHGPHFAVEDNLENWGQHMRAIVDPEINAAMSESAMATYEAEFSPAIVREQYHHVFQPSELISQRAPTIWGPDTGSAVVAQRPA